MNGFITKSYLVNLSPECFEQHQQKHFSMWKRRNLDVYTLPKIQIKNHIPERQHKVSSPILSSTY